MDTIKSKREFEHVFSCGRRYNNRLVTIYVLKKEEESQSGNVAFVAPKRLGTAVFRNRSKRVLREAARLCHLPRQKAQVILFATRKTAFCHPQEVADALQSLLLKAEV